jgi:hypothetical protein
MSADDVREAIEQFVANNPDAGVIDVLARGGGGIEPTAENREIAAAAVGGDQADAGGVEDADRADDDAGSGEAGGENDTGSSNEPDVAEQRQRFADRLDEVGVRTQRFINVPDGEKGGRANTSNHENPDNWMRADEVSGNYGIHPSFGLFEVDIDDYDGDRDTPALDALDDTLTVVSPHTSADDPGHRYYRVHDDAIAAVFERFGEGDKSYLNLEWGEVKRVGAYTVGPGSQLDGCDKEWCDECAEPDGGYYRLENDAPPAPLTPGELRAVLEEDPNINPPEGDSDGAKGGVEAGRTGSDRAAFGGFPDESPDEKPLCYHNALVARRDGGHAAENDRVIDQYAGILGLNAGFDLGEVVEHFREFAGSAGRSFDRETTRYQLRSIEKDGVAPVGEQKLREVGLLGESGCSDGCPIHGSDDGHTAQYAVETCVPPATDAETVDVDERRSELYERYQEWSEGDDAVVVWGDTAGSGKTTTATLAADALDRPHAIAGDKHAKVREHVDGDTTPDGYHHLKGTSQPLHDCCMDAERAAGPGETPECAKHGHPADWDRMCPIYERSKGDDLRQRYDTLMRLKGPMGAHLALNLFDDDEHPWHGERCPWHDALDALNDADTEYVAGVHEHQMLDTVREGEAVGERDLIIDESPREPGNSTTIEVAPLDRLATRLHSLATIGRSGDGGARLRNNLSEFAEFADRLREAIAADDTPPIEAVEPPNPKWEQYHEVKDPISGEGVRRKMKDETLAEVKIEYTESTITRLKNDDWKGEPLCFNALLAAAREAGLADGATRRAIAAADSLDGCPWCGAPVGDMNGARACSADDCRWNERDHTITQRDADPARAVAWLQSGEKPGEKPGVAFRSLPPASELPDDALVLDATATPERVAGIYGEPVENVEVQGDDALDLGGKLNLTQVLDGQYHGGTILGSETAHERMQRAIDAACTAYDKPLFGIKKKLKNQFDFPDNAEVLHYGGARGLNKSECDAVVCLGAPHPDMDDIRRQAAVFAQDHPELSVGGEEYSTRRDAGEIAENEPVYRKLRYADENGGGRAVPTKAYSGLAGKLFREAREKELEQFVHRVRPLLVDDDAPAKDGYLLTNVPTELPVANATTFDGLLDDLAGVFPASDGALRLLKYADDAVHGDAPDGFRAEGVVEYDRDAGALVNKPKGWHRLARLNGEDVSLRTVRRWINDLVDVGLLTREKYEQDEGVGYSAERAASTTALTILSINAPVEAASCGLTRRFREKVAAADRAAEWIAWVGRNFDVGGDADRGREVATDGGDRPPG